MVYQIEVCYSKDQTNKALFLMQKQGCEIVVVYPTSITFKDGNIGTQYTIYYRKPVQQSAEKKKMPEVDYSGYHE